MQCQKQGFTIILPIFAPPKSYGPGFGKTGESKNKHLKFNIMAKSQDAKKNVKKEPAKTAKEKKAAKREKKANRN
ncbi:MAG: hypothetical protein B6D64_04015 [Bacteroidetes bacterium 4484_276]|nr:MAG: hypothetical protein B6D64_04015 [Bacteroidetes bacterium 4484_276]